MAHHGEHPSASGAALVNDATVDVVVIGSGGGGLAAALTAACKGLDVVVLEKAPVFGGTTAISGGGLWIPGNPVAARSGTPDSEDAALTYFRQCTGDRFDEDLVRAFLANGRAMIEFFEQNTDVKFDVAVGRPDYHPALPGATNGGRTIHSQPYNARFLGRDRVRLRPPLREMTFLGMMIKPGPELLHFLNVLRSARSAQIVARKLLRHFRDLVLHGRAMDLSNGNALVGRLAKSAFDHGVRIHTSVAATELIRTGDRVTGVVYRGPEGSGQLHARRGVVLAAGGFPHDTERRKRLYPHAPTGHEHWSPAPETNTGDGLRMAEAIGADFNADLSDAAGWAPVSLVPAANGKTIAFPHLIDRQKPGFIAVTRRGRRFVNEANSYHDFGKGLAAACRGEAETCAFLIADHRTIRRYGIGTVKPAPIPLRSHLRSGYLIAGATPGELAQRAGIDPLQFEQTVAEFNRHAKQGQDPQFGRGESTYNRYNGDASHTPNPCVAPIEQGPFYAVRIVMGELGTFAGLRTDLHARVLSRRGVPIPGLYAAGNDVSNVMAGDYMSGGATLGPGMTFGYIAGCHLAESANVSTSATPEVAVQS